MLRLSDIITQSNVNLQVKTLLRIVKLILYLIIFVNAVGCTYWLFVSENIGMQYFRDDQVNGYVSLSQEVLLDNSGNQVPVNEAYYLMFG